ncbi:MAG: YdcF family protein [Candidatus Acidiferrales bacterium]
MTGLCESLRRTRNPQRGGIFVRLLFLLFFLGLLFVLYLARYPLLRLAGGFWVVDETPQTSDAIVILGDDNFHADRASRAAELFKAGLAPRVVASGRYLRLYLSIAELEEHDLTDRGVPAAAIVLLAHHATDTREEAVAISQLISSRGWKRVILVTSNYHTRRSEYICERIFPAGTVLTVVAAKDSEYDPGKWWWTRQGIKLFFHESVGMAVAMWELRHNSVRTVRLGLFDILRRAVSILSPATTLPVYSQGCLYYI